MKGEVPMNSLAELGKSKDELVDRWRRSSFLAQYHLGQNDLEGPAVVSKNGITIEIGLGGDLFAALPARHHVGTQVVAFSGAIAGFHLGGRTQRRS